MNRNNSPKLLIDPKKSLLFISPISLAFLTLSSLVLYPLPAGGAPETKTTVTNSQLEEKVKHLEKKYKSLPTEKDMQSLRKDLEKRVASQESQVKNLDNQVKSLPTKKDIEKLNTEIDSFEKSTLSLSQVVRWGIPFLLLNLVGSSLL
jgi:uncharacterized protein HemX